MNASHLWELASQVRAETLRLLATTDETWLTWAPPGTSNHILWHAGHALWLQDVLCVELVTGASELPIDWAETFGMDCRPVKETREWPPRSEVERRLAAQLARVFDLLDGLSPERLAVDSRPIMGNRSLASCIVHAWHDEAKHQGEMYLIQKLRRAAQR